jgi:hypothetical protein
MIIYTYNPGAIAIIKILDEIVISIIIRAKIERRLGVTN